MKLSTDTSKVVSAFRKLWMDRVRMRYIRGRITSERALQAILASGLTSLGSRFRILVEPAVEGPRRFRPDLCICALTPKDPHKGRIIAIVELKFELKKGAHWGHDFDKLTRMLMERNASVRDINPRDGKYRNRFTCDDGTIGIYAVVASYDCLAVQPAKLRKAADQRSKGTCRASLKRIHHGYGVVPHDSGKDYRFGWSTMRKH